MSAALTTSEWATRQATVPSGSMANVSSSDWTMTWASRGDPSRAIKWRCRAMVPAGVARRDLEPVGVEPVGDHQEAGGVPVERPRLVMDERREARRPCAARAFETELGAAQRVGILGGAGAQVDEGATRLGEGEDLGARAAAAPSPAGAQAARVGDGRVPGLVRHLGSGRDQPPARWPAATVGSASLSVVGSSAIGATIAFDRIRNVPGGTPKTAVGRPAAAHTTG